MLLLVEFQQNTQNEKMKKIVCFHLLNDFSGSPKVLRLVIDRLLKKGLKIDLVTSKGKGALSDLEKYKQIRLYKYDYTFSTNPLATLIRYMVLQFYVFFFSFRYLFAKDIVFYVNTILPIGAVLAGKLMGKTVVYHYHENANVKSKFYRLLAALMQLLASKIICVSEYQRAFLYRKKEVYVVPNAVPAEFLSQLKTNSQEAYNRKCILMLGSLKHYKGTLEFIELAKRLPQYRFELVLNEKSENIVRFWRENQVLSLKNLIVYSRQDNVAPFYNQASLVLNLSNKKLFVETFGMTALEAMSAGLPIIVPTVGGIAEMVENGVNGYKIDVQELDAIEERICLMLENYELYNRLSEGALSTSQRYSEEVMVKQIFDIIN